MSIVETVLNLLNKQAKPPVGSSSEREAKIKDKAGLVINIFALLLAVNTYIGGSLSSTIMNNTIKANDLWNFYQAKSIKQTLTEMRRDDAAAAGGRGQSVAGCRIRHPLARESGKPDRVRARPGSEGDPVRAGDGHDGDGP